MKICIWKPVCLAWAILMLLPISAIGEEDIVTTAARNGSFNTLVSLLVATGLDDALRGHDDFTVFAPTDEAFAKLPPETLRQLRAAENREQLADLLKYHVVGQRLSIPQHPPQDPVTSIRSLQGQRLEFQRKGSDVRVNGNPIGPRNIRCSNGLIHVINEVLMPPAKRNDIAAVAQQTGQFKTLLAAVEAAGLTEALTGEGPLTVLAPTDEAFAQLGDQLKELVQPENRDQLAAILKYHVIPGRVTANQALQAGKAKTLSGQSVQFSIQEGRLRANGARVIRNDVTAENGIIHVIDQVLIPDHGDSTTPTSASESSRVVLRANWRNPIDRDGIEADVVEIRVSGGGTARLKNVRAREIITRIAGGGTLSIEGHAETHRAQVNGGARLEARDLRTQSSEIRVNSGGQATVNAQQELAIAANSGANVRYVDTGAQISKSINRSASFGPLQNSHH